MEVGWLDPEKGRKKHTESDNPKKLEAFFGLDTVSLRIRGNTVMLEGDIVGMSDFIRAIGVNPVKPFTDTSTSEREALR